MTRNMCKLHNNKFYLHFCMHCPFLVRKTHIPSTLHNVETCGQSNILAQYIFKIIAMDFILNIKLPNLLCILTRLWLKCTTQIWRSKHFSRNWSARTNMTNIKTCISQLIEVGMTLSYFSVSTCGLIFHPWKFGCPL